MTAGRVFLAGILALALAVGASSTASAGAGLRFDLSINRDFIEPIAQPLSVSNAYPAAVLIGNMLYKPAGPGVLSSAMNSL